MRLRFSRLDALLLAMTVIWGGNYSLIKSALDEVPAIAFNGVRLAIASTLFLAAISFGKGGRTARPLLAAWSRADYVGLAALAVVGHAVYQLLFISALARTSAATSALIIGCTPIFVALMTAALGDERVTGWVWAGTFLSAAGIYVVVGGAGAIASGTVRGDLMMLSAVLCWSASAVGSRSLLSRHSPLVVTGCSMAIGTVLYLAFEWRAVAAVDWRSVSTHAWWSIVLSAVFALCVAYMIWYTALQRVGNTRTAVYSNLVPVAGMIVAWSWLGESIEAGKIVGAVAILTGVTLTKLHSSTAAEMHVGLQPGTTDQPPLIPASDPQSPSRFNSASARARVDG